MLKETTGAFDGARAHNWQVRRATHCATPHHYLSYNMYVNLKTSTSSTQVVNSPTSILELVVKWKLLWSDFMTRNSLCITRDLLNVRRTGLIKVSNKLTKRVKQFITWLFFLHKPTVSQRRIPSSVCGLNDWCFIVPWWNNHNR